MKMMRAAAKVAGVGVFAAGTTLRNMSLPAEQQAFSASRKSYTPISSVASSSIDGSSSTAAADQSVVQRPAWELDDWEIAGVEEDPMPRVVFGGAPSKEEAEVATLELKDALEKVYFGSNGTTGAEGPLPLPVCQDDGMVVSSHSGNSNCYVTGGTVERSVAKPAMQAFKFLSSSPEAQKVVVSIVSDENVWGAVFKNEAFVEYLESQRGSVVTGHMESEVNQSDVDDEVKSTDASSKLKQSGSLLGDFIDSVKLSVIDLANNVSGFFQNFFGGGETEKKSADAGDPAVIDMTAVGSYIMGLAVMVITVVVLKRV